MMVDEVFKLITYKRMGLSVKVPDELKEEFDRRYSEYEKHVEDAKLNTDPAKVKRYTYDAGDGNWRFPGHVQRDDGEWVEWEEFERVVKHLQGQVDRAYAEGKSDGSDTYSWRL